MWVLVVLRDGFADPELFGNADGQPFATQQEAEEAARIFPVRGARYSVYTRQIGSL